MKSSSSSDPAPGPRDPLAELARQQFAPDHIAEQAVAGGAAPDAVERCLADYRELLRSGARVRFGELLVRRGAVTTDGLRAAMKAAGVDVFACPHCREAVEGRPEDAVCPSCGGPMQRAVLIETATSERDDSSRPSPGSLFGRYRILEVLGMGGAAVVYKAYDPSVDRHVALKFLREDMREEAHAERFRREGIALGRLSHPNIVAVHEAGVAGGRAYLAMALVEGEPITKAAATLGLGYREKAGLLETVARAVHEAHLKDIVHRDLKPGNVFVNGDGVPIVMDFGLARFPAGSARITRSEAVVGTPHYMAPEQLGGGEVDARTDVYSLGVILYELLAGRVPHHMSSVAEVYQSILSVEPVPLRSIDPRVPVDLESIVGRCLEKDPGRRYPSALALANDLRRFQAGEPTEARPVSAAGRIVRRFRGRLLTLAFAAAAIVSVSVGTVVTLQLLRARDTHELELALREAKEGITGWWRDRYLPAHDMTPSARRLEAVLVRLEGMVARHRASAALWGWKGVLEKELLRTEAALASLEEATRLDPDEGAWRYWRGRVHIALHKEDLLRTFNVENEEDLRREKADDWPELERAAGEYRRALDAPRWSDARPWEAECARAYILWRRREIGEARRACEEIAARHAEGGEEGLLLRTDIEFFTGNLGSERDCFDRIAERARSLAAAYSGAARTRMLLSQQPGLAPGEVERLYGEALGRIGTALSIQPGDSHARLTRGVIRSRWACSISGVMDPDLPRNPDKARAMLREALDQDFDPAAIDERFQPARAYLAGHCRFWLATLNREGWRYDEELLRGAVADLLRVPADSRLYLRARLGRGELHSKWALARRALGKDPSEPALAGIDDLTLVLQRQPGSAKALVERGMIRFYLGEFQVSRKEDPSGPFRDALADLEECVRLDAANVDGWLHLALTHHTWAIHLGDTDPPALDHHRRALEAFEKALKLKPGFEERSRKFIDRSRAALGMPREH